MSNTQALAFQVGVPAQRRELPRSLAVTRVLLYLMFALTLLGGVGVVDSLLDLGRHITPTLSLLAVYAVTPGIAAVILARRLWTGGKLVWFGLIGLQVWLVVGSVVNLYAGSERGLSQLLLPLILLALIGAGASRAWFELPSDRRALRPRMTRERLRREAVPSLQHMIKWRRNRGQSTVEYVGMIGLVSLIIGTLLFSGVGTQVATGLQNEVCKILGGDSCPSDTLAGGGGETGGGDAGGNDSGGGNNGGGDNGGGNNGGGNNGGGSNGGGDNGGGSDGGNDSGGGSNGGGDNGGGNDGGGDNGGGDNGGGNDGGGSNGGGDNGGGSDGGNDSGGGSNGGGDNGGGSDGGNDSGGGNSGGGDNGGGNDGGGDNGGGNNGGGSSGGGSNGGGNSGGGSNGGGSSGGGSNGGGSSGGGSNGGGSSDGGSNGGGNSGGGSNGGGSNGGGSNGGGNSGGGSNGGGSNGGGSNGGGNSGGGSNGGGSNGGGSSGGGSNGGGNSGGGSSGGGSNGGGSSSGGSDGGGSSGGYDCNPVMAPWGITQHCTTSGGSGSNGGGSSSGGKDNKDEDDDKRDDDDKDKDKDKEDDKDDDKIQCNPTGAGSQWGLTGCKTGGSDGGKDDKDKEKDKDEKDKDEKDDEENDEDKDDEDDKDDCPDATNASYYGPLTTGVSGSGRYTLASAGVRTGGPGSLYAGGVALAAPVPMSPADLMLTTAGVSLPGVDTYQDIENQISNALGLTDEPDNPPDPAPETGPEEDDGNGEPGGSCSTPTDPMTVLDGIPDFRPADKKQWAQEVEDIARQNPLTKDFTAEDALIVADYTGSWALDANKYLRGDPIPGRRGERVPEFIERMDQALEHLPPVQGTFHRGTFMPEDLLERFANGDEVELPEYLSTSSDPAKADRAAKNAKSNGRKGENVVMEITTDDGRNIDPLSRYRGKESEVLIPRGGKFVKTGETTKIIDGKEYKVIQVKQVP
ncbi:ADP-ribosyltransferase [Streptomyces sp. NBC_01498]|uniref:ADP-ribosyltransferase n=1 Tax=Streptomyces sp. NBC_01498 TaxID=2975870 RepID=UPI002E7C198B|nr:ADP-ribosyltransferase [Streptomyces sp. NBC_01498]WTL25532.1 ADP-ribosyltransferase [Streptomyces sp. NBC_01498]